MIPDACRVKIEQIAQADKITQGFVEIFTAVANDAQTSDKPAATLVIPMYDADDPLKSGDYACELHFVVRRVE